MYISQKTLGYIEDILFHWSEQTEDRKEADELNELRQFLKEPRECWPYVRARIVIEKGPGDLSDDPPLEFMYRQYMLNSNDQYARTVWWDSIYELAIGRGLPVDTKVYEHGTPEHEIVSDLVERIHKKK